MSQTSHPIARHVAEPPRTGPRPIEAPAARWRGQRRVLPGDGTQARHADVGPPLPTASWSRDLQTTRSFFASCLVTIGKQSL